jgi:hypothetical protein
MRPDKHNFFVPILSIRANFIVAGEIDHHG